VDGSGRLAGLRYTDLPNYIPDFENRRDVAFDDLTDGYGVAARFGSPDTHLTTAAGEPRVPYRFCSDEFAGATSTCLRFDSGADTYEIAEDLINRYLNYYIFNSFKRDRVSCNPIGYL